MASRDPEIDELLAATRLLTAQAFLLSRSIDTTVKELVEFIQDRPLSLPNEGTNP